MALERTKLTLRTASCAPFFDACRSTTQAAHHLAHCSEFICSVNDLLKRCAMLQRHSNTVDTIRACVLTATLLLALSAAGCSRAALKETERRGNQVVTALTRYQTDNGHYPASLEELTPKYLREIPSPTWGLKQWRYENNGSRFTLMVDESHRTGDGDAQYLNYSDRHGWQLAD